MADDVGAPGRTGAVGAHIAAGAGRALLVRVDHGSVLRSRRVVHARNGGVADLGCRTDDADPTARAETSAARESHAGAPNGRGQEDHFHRDLIISILPSLRPLLRVISGMSRTDRTK